MDNGVFDFTSKLDLMSIQFVGEVWIDSDSNELLRLAFGGVFQDALDIILADLYFFNTVFFEVCFKLTVGNLFNLAGLHPEAMEEQYSPNSDEDIPNIEFGFFIHREDYSHSKPLCQGYCGGNLSQARMQ